MSNNVTASSVGSALRITDGTGASFAIFDEQTSGLWLAASDGGEARVYVDIAPEDEAALLDKLTARANVKRDKALAEMHDRRYYRQGPAVRRDLTRS